MQMSYSYASDLPFRNFCKLAKRAETTRNYQKQKLTQFTRYRSKEVSYRTFFYRTNTKFYAKLSGDRTLFIHSAKLKKFSTLKNTPFPLNQSIKVHRRALVLPVCLILYHRCEKSARESRNSHQLITQRSHNVTTSTREPTTGAWISADK